MEGPYQWVVLLHVIAAFTFVLAHVSTGVAAGFIARLWGKGWIWAAIVLLVLMFAAMDARAST
jgi:hypothetical protein